MLFSSHTHTQKEQKNANTEEKYINQNLTTTSQANKLAAFKK